MTDRKIDPYDTDTKCLARIRALVEAAQKVLEHPGTLENEVARLRSYFRFIQYALDDAKPNKGCGSLENSFAEILRAVNRIRDELQGCHDAAIAYADLRLIENTIKEIQERINNA
jgi:hypothetical protein